MQDNFKCPITQEIMVDPVILSDGHSYERSAIERWLVTHNTSPLTRERLTSKDITPNWTLKGLIAEWSRQGNLPQVVDDVAAHQMDIDAVLSDIQVQIKSFNDDFLSFHAIVSVPEAAPPAPLCLVCVLDVSGSMDDITQTGVNGDEPVPQFSRLDLVKHSMLTTIAFLRPQDYLMIISFSSHASVVLGYTQMTTLGKTTACDAVNKLNADGATNLWGGLELGIDHALKPPRAGLNVAIILQTDGEPTASLSPQRGIEWALKTKLSLQNNAFSIHTCGYGYGATLDTPLLRQIANHGKGSFAYIPDGSMVGTVFIHLIVNLMATVLTNVELNWESGESRTIPSLRPGQVYHLIIPDSRVPRVTACNGAFSGNVIMTRDITPVAKKQVFEWHRKRFVDCLEESITLAERGRVTEAAEFMNGFAEDLLFFASDTDAQLVNALACDILPSADSSKGQLEKAFRFWTKWGRHYLPNILSAHSRQEKVNFKDASLEMYSTDALDLMITQAELTFSRLPAPRPRGFSRHGTSVAPGNYSAPVNMSAMVNRSGGCISGDTRIRMGDGNLMRMDELKPGMEVLHGFQIRYVIKYHGNFACVCQNGLTITPYHPVRLRHTDPWTFPNRTFTDFAEENEVFNLVLDKGHYVRTGFGIECITLGHGITNDGVAEHPYFGTEEAIKDLERVPGFETGYIVYRDPVFLVNPATKVVFSIVERSSMLSNELA